MNSQARYNEFRNAVLASMQKYNVKYKLFGGGAVTLILDHRLTMDIDMALKHENDNRKRFVEALVDCGFGDTDYIEEHLSLLDEEEYLENFTKERHTNKIFNIY